MTLLVVSVLTVSNPIGLKEVICPSCDDPFKIEPFVVICWPLKFAVAQSKVGFAAGCVNMCEHSNVPEFEYPEGIVKSKNNVTDLEDPVPFAG